jgi:hypothetical protein
MISFVPHGKFVLAVRFLPLVAKLEYAAVPQIDTRKSGAVQMTAAMMLGMMEMQVVVGGQEQNHRGFQLPLQIHWR